MNILVSLLFDASSDVLAEGLTALVAGMGTVFIILILISFIISLFKHFSKNGKTKDLSRKNINAVVEETKQESHPIKAETQMDELELIAVLTAAIAASLNTSSDKLQVKSFRRISSRRR